jgi:hypothetical protein
MRSKLVSPEFDQPLPEQQRHMIAQILDQHLVEDLGMLVEQGGDIGFRARACRDSPRFIEASRTAAPP